MKIKRPRWKILQIVKSPQTMCGKKFKCLIGLTCVASLQLIVFEQQYNRDTLYDVPNLENYIDIQHKGFSYVNPLNEFNEKYIYKINPAKSMSQTKDRASLQLIIIVKSYILNFGQRRTWGGRTSLRSKTVFVVGYLEGCDDLIKQESKQYKDIVQLNVSDQTVRILAIAVAFLKAIPIEDAYIGIVAKSVNIKLKHHYRYLPFKQAPFTLWNTASSPGYEMTYNLLRDWNLIRAMNS
ncbi:unnamed protein product [Mytilus coruscus]|uniref:Hexosyltransferase n=1 Tax=Mytilus coruscus TaxID=42192 RepID=A0A6J8C576_MYTCO|nr:unnamed protein product [Mytilus coruscus]